MKRRGSIEMEPQIDRTPNILAERTLKTSHSSGSTWLGCAIVLLCAGFFLLTLREGTPTPDQRFVDSIFHDWIVMGSTTILLWVVRSISGKAMPRLFQILSGFLMLFFALITGLGLVAWTPLWLVLKTFGISQAKTQPLVAFALIAIWLLICIGFVLRATFRWLRSRYEHHGVAVGLGPFYFYFRRRRAS